jgi:hypothetical protein
MMSISCILFFSALIAGILESMGKCPGWVPSILLAIAGLLTCLPR